MKPTVNLNDFVFTQNNMQSYLDCPRQFELRYLLKQECPPLSTAAQTASQRFTALGNQFHLLLHRHFIGLSIEEFPDQQNDAEIQTWWQQFRSSNPLPANYTLMLPELSLSCRSKKARLMAKLDLLVTTAEHQLLIFDWKTSPNPQSIHILKTRVQTRLYPLVVSKIGHFAGSDFSPDQVKMVYWFASHPDKTVVISYSNPKMQSDEIFLDGLIEEIRSLPIGEFQQTSDLRRCDYCDYFLICRKQENAQYLASTIADIDIMAQPSSDTLLDEEISYRTD